MVENTGSIRPMVKCKECLSASEIRRFTEGQKVSELTEVELNNLLALLGRHLMVVADTTLNR